MCSYYPGIKLEPALQRLGHEIEHLSSYAHVVRITAKQVIPVAGRMKMSANCKFPKIKHARAKHVKLLFFIVKCANL